jgi:hypothetical protein
MGQRIGSALAALGDLRFDHRDDPLRQLATLSRRLAVRADIHAVDLSPSAQRRERKRLGRCGRRQQLPEILKLRRPS